MGAIDSINEVLLLASLLMYLSILGLGIIINIFASPECHILSFSPRQVRYIESCEKTNNFSVCVCFLRGYIYFFQGRYIVIWDFSERKWEGATNQYKWAINTWAWGGERIDRPLSFSLSLIWIVKCFLRLTHLRHCPTVEMRWVDWEVEEEVEVLMECILRGFGRYGCLLIGVWREGEELHFFLMVSGDMGRIEW